MKTVNAALKADSEIAQIIRHCTVCHCACCISRKLSEYLGVKIKRSPAIAAIIQDNIFKEAHEAREVTLTELGSLRYLACLLQYSSRIKCTTIGTEN